MIDLWLEFVTALWILIPMYAANGFPPLARGKHPIDFGKKLKDGKRIFGDGKTIEGFALGVGMGTFYGAIEMYLYPVFVMYAAIWGANIPAMTLPAAFMLSLGALVGDLCGSFIKRRAGFDRGANVPLLDQLNFVAGGIVFALPFIKISLWTAGIAFIITPVIHRVVCMAGYMLKFKQVPW